MANRRMRPFVILVLALASGALAGLMALQYLRSASGSLMAESPKGRAAVASRDLDVGTVLTPADVKVVEWPGAILPAGYISSSELAVGRGLTTASRRTSRSSSPSSRPRAPVAACR